MQDVATNDLVDLGLPFCPNLTTRSFNSNKGNATPDKMTGIELNIIDTEAEKCDYGTQHDAVNDDYDQSITNNEQTTTNEWMALCTTDNRPGSTSSY